MRTRREHLAIVDEHAVHRQFAFLRKHRKDVWDEVVKPAVRGSWKRTDPRGVAEEQRQRALL